ncbi:MAG: rod shape-determining protein MreC [Rickettsiales bacterium]|nr:rod shape-determining protein MreC [Rickettsiales bacterium]
MKQYLNFSQTKSNYSLQHNFNLIFKKIELALFCFLCVISLITCKINKDFCDEISMSFVSISLPIVNFAAFPFNATINLLTNFSELVDAKKENQILKEENEKLRDFYIKSLNVNRENKELKDTLRFVTTKSSSYKVARISGRTHQIFNQALFIDAGKNRGIKEGSIVTGNHGVIGRIAQVGDNQSRLILVTDANSRIPVLASKARVRGILAGNNSSKMEILYLQKNHNIRRGDWIFTSGDGDTLPPGLLIGVVRKVGNSYAEVVMTENINNTDIVTILDY